MLLFWNKVHHIPGNQMSETVSPEVCLISNPIYFPSCYLGFILHQHYRNVFQGTLVFFEILIKYIFLPYKFLVLKKNIKSTYCISLTRGWGILIRDHPQHELRIHALVYRQFCWTTQCIDLHCDLQFLSEDLRLCIQLVWVIFFYVLLLKVNITHD